MKILLISDYATPTGGAELMMLSLRDGLRKRAHDASTPKFKRQYIAILNDW